MTLGDWVTETADSIRSDGIVVGSKKSGEGLALGAMYRAHRLLPVPSIFDRSWDALIILDACRPDLLQEVSDEYEFLPDEIETIWSRGSSSHVWMDRTFTDEYAAEIRETVHVTGNPYSRDHLNPAAFAELDEVWEYEWDEDRGTIPARPITDSAIENARHADFERLIVHYMQPHFPSIPKPLDSEISLEEWGTGWESVWDDLEKGRVSKEAVWDSYRKNLRYVLDDVELLLSNLDVDTAVITADHGNAIGEWGLYGHPAKRASPELNRVPWVEVSATDTESYTPTVDSDTDTSAHKSVEERLRDLGYK